MLTSCVERSSSQDYKYSLHVSSPSHCNDAKRMRKMSWCAFFHLSSRGIRSVDNSLQVQTGAQRKVKTEAVATCVCRHRKSTNTPPNTPACVLRARSWLPTASAAGLVSQSVVSVFLRISFNSTFNLYLVILAISCFLCQYTLYFLYTKRGSYAFLCLCRLSQRSASH